MKHTSEHGPFLLTTHVWYFFLILSQVVVRRGLFCGFSVEITEAILLVLSSSLSRTVSEKRFQFRIIE